MEVRFLLHPGNRPKDPHSNGNLEKNIVLIYVMGKLKIHINFGYYRAFGYHHAPTFPDKYTIPKNMLVGFTIAPSILFNGLLSQKV